MGHHLGLVYPEATAPVGNPFGIVTNQVTESVGNPWGIVTDQVTETVGAAPSESNVWKWMVALTAVAGAAGLAYHGYKRSGSSAAAVGWGILGAIFPINLVAGGVAVAQGFGKKRGR
jgi:hypothetical protein